MGDANRDDMPDDNRHHGRVPDESGIDDTDIDVIIRRTEKVSAGAKGIGGERYQKLSANQKIREIVRQMIGNGDRYQGVYEQTGDLDDRPARAGSQFGQPGKAEIDREEHQRKRGKQRIPGLSAGADAIHCKRSPHSGVSLKPSKVTVDSITITKAIVDNLHGSSTISALA